MRDIPTPHLQGGGKGVGLAGALMEGVLAKLLKKKKEWEDKYCAVACRSRETVTGEGEVGNFKTLNPAEALLLYARACVKACMRAPSQEYWCPADAELPAHCRLFLLISCLPRP
jgi:hypothetical protein